MRHQDIPAVDYTTSGSRAGEWNETLSAPAQVGSCYSSSLNASGGGFTKSAAAGPACWSGPPSPPPPPPVPTVCDPGHPGCGGNGTSEEPLILDLNGDGIHTTSLETAPVQFDMNADGRPDLTAWTDSHTEEGLLFYDRNHNHTVDGNEELFGNRTPLPDGTTAATGVDALAAYDKRQNGGNDDGQIAAGDMAWGILRVWVDRNHDGIANESETHSLGQLGIEAIDLVFERLGPEQSFGVDSSGNFHVFQGHFRQRRRGQPDRPVHGDIHDVFFRVTYQ